MEKSDLETPKWGLRPTIPAAYRMHRKLTSGGSL